MPKKICVNTNNSTSSNDESNIKDTNISTNEKTSNNNSNVGDNSNSNTQVVSVPNTASSSYFGIIGLIVLGMIFTYIKRISNK